MVVVGGGAALCGEALQGASRIIRPKHASVANAVGAATPQAWQLSIMPHDMSHIKMSW